MVELTINFEEISIFLGILNKFKINFWSCHLMECRAPARMLSEGRLLLA